MNLQPGTLLSHYRLEAKIGAGGMGEVWRATDTTLDRSVAVKILPEGFSEEPERLVRFEREAKLLASLNHPNIAVIHGFHHADGVHFLAMELAEGEDLARRIQQGALPPEEAFSVGKQVAEALEAAHESGVVHRDLKPANIQLAPDGKVKVLDFGLAKAFETESRSGSPSMSPTLTSAGTRAGMILGTAAYMSPEQARGRPVDRRTDIWSFGCVMYEVLSGRQAFPGETISDTLAAVLKSEPDWTALPPGLPAAAGNLLKRCLVKDPRQRLQAMGDARIALDRIASGGQEEAPAVSWTPMAARSSLAWRILPWLLFAAALVAGPWISRLSGPAPRRTAQPEVRLEVDLSTPEPLLGEPGSAMVLSPDGTQLAYVAGPGDQRKLFVRRLDQLQGIPLAGTEGAYSPFFSSDGRTIAFFAGSKLKKVGVTGGSPLSLADIESGEQARGGAWGRGGTIVFTRQFEAGLSKISESGGTPVTLTKPDPARRERSHRWPCFLPDGKTVLFAVQGAGERYDEASIEAVSLETGKRKLIYRGGAFPRYASTGHLLFVRGGTLFALPFDPEKLEVHDSPRSLLESLASATGDQEAGDGSAQMDVSASGTLVYRSGALAQSALTMVWTDRKGTVTPVLPDKRAFSTPSVSPDGKRIAVSIEGASGADIWIYEIDRGLLTRFTFDGAGNQLPVWSPDGQRIAYSSLGKKGVPNLFWKRADGAGDAERLIDSPGAQYPQSFSPDGKILAFYERNADTIWDISTVRIGEKAAPEPFLKTPAIEGFPEFSPDGRWMAYMSDESGQTEVYVRPFPGPGGKWQVSTQGGLYPRWSRAGKELFYRSGDKILGVTWSASGSSFVAERPRELFSGIFAHFLLAQDFDVTPDGRRFVMFTPEGEEARLARTHVILVFNWLEDLRRAFH
jgi:eukaryotic-like serine/threonine-protein kinase